MISIIVAIISLINSCVAIYLNLVKDIFISKQNVRRERLEKFYIPFYQKYCAGFLTNMKFSTLCLDARSVFLDLFTNNIHLMDASSQALYSKFYQAFLNLLEAENNNPDYDIDECSMDLDIVFNEICLLTFNEYRRILKQCHLPAPSI